MKVGLTDRDIETLEKILSQYPQIKLVHIFGSRAKGTYHQGSDIDLAVMNEGLEYHDLLRLKSDLDESHLPYVVDIVNYPDIKHQELKEHIDRVGKPIYRGYEHSKIH